MALFERKLKAPSRSRIAQLIRGVVVTEKASLVSQNNCYVFEVASSACKHEIVLAVQQFFGVTVVGVNTLNVKGKTRRFKNIRGRTANWKKAIVTLKPEDSIEIY